MNDKKPWALLDSNGKIVKKSEGKCNHGVKFDSEAAKDMSPADIKRKYPRLFGSCPLGCGFSGIAYASNEHYFMGDW